MIAHPTKIKSTAVELVTVGMAPTSLAVNASVVEDAEILSETHSALLSPS